MCKKNMSDVYDKYTMYMENVDMCRIYLGKNKTQWKLKREIKKNTKKMKTREKEKNKKPDETDKNKHWTGLLAPREKS